MQSDDQRRDGAQDDVEIQPVPGISLPAQPDPFFAQRVEINQEKQEHTEHAQVDANPAARPQQIVLGRIRPLTRTQRVVVESVEGKSGHEQQGRQPAGRHQPTVVFLRRIRAENDGLYGSRGLAHRLCPISS